MRYEDRHSTPPPQKLRRILTTTLTPQRVESYAEGVDTVHLCEFTRGRLTSVEFYKIYLRHTLELSFNPPIQLTLQVQAHYTRTQLST